jgi:hypothetical protein
MRTLVLLLSSGHTVRIALRENDLTHNGGPTAVETREFVGGLAAVCILPDLDEIAFAYVQDNGVALNDDGHDYNRISLVTRG